MTEPIELEKNKMNKITLSMTLKKCELLDSILKAFGNEEHLGKEEVLAIFNGNENLAADHTEVLAKLNFIQKIVEI